MNIASRRNDNSRTRVLNSIHHSCRLVDLEQIYHCFKIRGKARNDPPAVRRCDRSAKSLKWTPLGFSHLEVVHTTHGPFGQ